MASSESGKTEKPRKSLEERVKDFAELERLDAYVREYTNLYFTTKQTLTETEKTQIESDAAFRSIFSPKQAAAVVDSQEGRMLEEAREQREQSPDKAAYTLARLTKLQKTAGRRFSETQLEVEALIGAEIKDFKTAPTLPELRTRAILLGIKRDYLKHMDYPTLAELVGYVKAGVNISEFIADKEALRLSDTALLVDEHERQEYLAAFPEEKTREVSALLDFHASKVLHFNVPHTSSEREQVKGIESRTSTELDNILNSRDFIALPGMLKLIALTLAELDSFDSVHYLALAGELGLDKKSIVVPGETKQDRLARWSRFARIFATQASVPSQQANAGMLGMKYLALVHLPDRLFTFFIHKMVQSGFMTGNVLLFTSNNPDNKYLLHEIITKYPSQFNTIIDTLSEVEGFSAEHHTKDTLSALSELGTLTPKALETYMAASRRERRDLFEDMKRIRTQLYQNIPGNEVVPSGSNIPLAEHLYMATDPVNLSYRRFVRMLEKLEDRTSDLEKFKFVPEGYSFEVHAGLGALPKLKEGAQVDTALLNRYRTMFDTAAPQAESLEAKALLEVFLKIAKGGTFPTADPGIAALFSVFREDKDVQELLQKFPSVAEENSYPFILELEPLLKDPGVQARYAKQVEAFLQANSSLTTKIEREFANVARVNTLKQRVEKVRKEGFHLGVAIPDSVSNPKEMSELITASVFATILSTNRKEISAQEKKFNKSRERSRIENVGNLKAYISASEASFFAKAAVGICSLGDVLSWNNANSFHINVVEDEENLRANIQAMVISVEGGQALLLRGFNPNAPFLKRIDPGVFCEEILKIAERFQIENGLEGIYITEQAEWHALSNRKPISDYLVGTYVKPEAEVQLDKPTLMISNVKGGPSTISSIYKVR